METGINTPTATVDNIDTFESWFNVAVKSMPDLLSSFQIECPAAARIAIVRKTAESEPFIGVYVDENEGRKKVGPVKSPVILNGKTLETKIFLLRSPSGEIDKARRHEYTSTEEAKRVNAVITKYSNELFTRSNVSIVMGETIDGSSKILIYVFHNGVLLNNDTPLPSILDGFDVVVREGAVQYQ
jgi:hypothetical protein